MERENVKLGLRQNWFQFTILVVINAFVGGMVGLERTLIPSMAEASFNLAAHTALLTFIMAFGIVKAISNYYAGVFANKIGRKNLLLIGWVLGLPVPLILMYANVWEWVIFANILLGINQGLCWSSTVVMKIDLVGKKHRGLAMGLNESVGYLAVGSVAFLTGWIAAEYGLRPYPFYMGIGFALLGILLTLIAVKDTKRHAILESKSHDQPLLKSIFWDTTWRNRNLGSISQAGLVNNLNDGLIWGIFPLLLASLSFSLEKIGQIVAIYPIVWGLGQLFTGKLSDHVNKKHLLFTGMMLQAIVLILMAFATTFLQFMVLSSLLGLGTALVYPTFLAGIADYVPPAQRAESIGVFRLWRDLGYTFGALITGMVADILGIESSILVVGIITGISAVIILVRMK